MIFSSNTQGLDTYRWEVGFFPLSLPSFLPTLSKLEFSNNNHISKQLRWLVIMETQSVPFVGDELMGRNRVEGRGLRSVAGKYCEGRSIS